MKRNGMFFFIEMIPKYYVLTKENLLGVVLHLLFCTDIWFLTKKFV